MQETSSKQGKIAGITTDQAKDTGMAMVLILLLLAKFAEMPHLVAYAIVVLLINMIKPQIFKPLAVLWFGLSNALGAVMSKVLLSAIFFLVVTPIGLLRRLLRKDSLQLTAWKKGTESVFKVRQHKYVAGDIEQPF